MTHSDPPKLPPHIAAQEVTDLALANEELRRYQLRLRRIATAFANGNQLANSTDPSLFLACLQVHTAQSVISNLTAHYDHLRAQYANAIVSYDVSDFESSDDEFPISEDDPWFGSGVQHPVDTTGTTSANQNAPFANVSIPTDPTPPYTSLPGSPAVQGPTEEGCMPPKTPLPPPAASASQLGQTNHFDGFAASGHSQQGTSVTFQGQTDKLAPPGLSQQGTGRRQQDGDVFATPSQSQRTGVPASHPFSQPVLLWPWGPNLPRQSLVTPTPLGPPTPPPTQGGPAAPMSPSTPHRLNTNRPFLMSPFPDQRHYAVFRGRRTGVYLSWDEAKIYVNGIDGAAYQGFPSYAAALDAYFRLRTLRRVRVIRGPGDTDEDFGDCDSAEDI